MQHSLHKPIFEYWTCCWTMDCLPKLHGICVHLLYSFQQKHLHYVAAMKFYVTVYVDVLDESQFEAIDHWCCCSRRLDCWKGRLVELIGTFLIVLCYILCSAQLSLYQPSLHWKSQIAHSDVRHSISGINSLIHSVSLASHILTHLLIHLSAHLYHHHSCHPSLFHSRIKTCQNQQIFPTLVLLLWSAFTIMGPHQTYRAFWLILVLFFSNFSVPFGGLSWLHFSFLLLSSITTACDFYSTACFL